MAHHVWAPLLRAAWDKASSVFGIYVEPLHYRPLISPTSPTIYDLSTSFGGLAPLPGFARLNPVRDDAKSILVAMLGFEGRRPLHLALEVDSISRLIPIIGVPGFRIEYPAAAVASNRELLDQYHAHSDIRLARASCPFDAFQVLEEIHAAYPDHYLYIAPVGTKPHAVAAILYAIKHPDSSELLYDHPARKAGRSWGVGKVHVYDLRSIEATGRA